MALLGNYSVLAKSPGRSLSGNVASGDRAQSGKSGALRCRYVGGFDPKSALPNGYQHPGAWQLARVSGGLSTYTLTLGTGTVASGNLAGGKNGTADLTGSGTISDATAALIVSAVAALTGSGSITNAAALAFLNAAADLAGSGDLTAARTALGHAVAALTGGGSITVTPRADGELEAAITLAGEGVTPTSVAAAVWDNPAGAFLVAASRNRVVTDPAAGTYTVYADDNTTPLYVADLWADAAGTVPYAGSGAERRDRLE